MTDLLVQFGISNLCVSIALAIVAYTVHRTGRLPVVAHVLWVLVLVKLVTPPIFTLPVMPVPAFLVPAAETRVDLSGLESAGAAMAELHGPSALADPAMAAMGSTRATSIVDDAKTGLLFLWLLGSAVVLVWSLVRVHRFNRWLGIAAHVAPPPVQRVATELGQRLGLRTTPTIQLTSAHVSPLVWWVGGRVRIVIPEALPREMDAGQLRWILAHELAHVRRRDHLVRWLEWLACVGFWWNPVAWWARRNLRINEEICCDALVLSSFQPGARTYANALMTVVEFLASPAIRPPAAASEMNSGGLLEKRFSMIVSNRPILRTQRWLRASVLLCAVGFVPLGLTSVDAAAQDTRGVDRAADGTSKTELLDILGDLVASGTMDGKLAFELYVASQESVKQEVVAAGTMTPEAFEKRLGMAMRLAIAGAELKQAVADGTMTEEEAWAKYDAIQEAMGTPEKRGAKAMSDRSGDRMDWDAIKKRIEGAVERGEITREEADAKYKALKERMAAGGDGGAMWRRVAVALAEGGVPPDQIKPVIGAMERIVAELKAEGDRFELDPGMLAYLEKLGLTDEQIKLVIGLAQRVAYAPAAMGGDEGDGDAIWRRVAGALAEAGIERGQLREVIGAMERIVGEVKAEGDRFELDPNMLAYLEKIGLTDEQIKLVVGLAQRVAYAPAAMGEDDGGGGDAMRRRVASALAEAGIPRDQIRDVLGAMERIVAEMKAEGDRFELDPNMLAYLQEIGLTEGQIELVVGLAQRVADARAASSRDRDGARSDWDVIQKRIETAVERGDMTRAEADALYRQIRERMAGAHDR